MQDKCLVTDWGRVLKFDYARLDDSLYRAGYSFDPQANVADHMNQKGLKPLADWFEREQCGRINVHAHDALFFSVVPERAWDATKFLIDSLESPFTYHGTSLCMPCEVKVGLSWKGTSSWGQSLNHLHLRRQCMNSRLDTILTAQPGELEIVAHPNQMIAVVNIVGTSVLVGLDMKNIAAVLCRLSEVRDRLLERSQRRQPSRSTPPTIAQ